MSGAKLRAVHGQNGAPAVVHDVLGVEALPNGAPVGVEVLRLRGMVVLRIAGQGGLGLDPEHAYQLGARLMRAATAAAGPL